MFKIILIQILINVSKKNMLCLMVFFYTGIIFSQNKQEVDTIYINFNKCIDKITNKKFDKTTTVEIFNPEYRKELEIYNDEIKKFNDSEPYQPYPQKPRKFINFPIIEKKCSVLSKKDLSKISFYDKKQISNLSPYGKIFYIIIPADENYKKCRVSLNMIVME